MRYQPEHKTEVHGKLVKDAARRVRGEGLNGAAVAAVMRGAGMTHGGFYKHFESKDDLLVESLREAFREIGDSLIGAAEEAQPGEAWKAIVKTYLKPEYCEHAERGCPLTALAPELARTPETMKGQVFAVLVSYKNRILPFMPGHGKAAKDRAFFAIFSTLIGAVELARMMPEPAARQKVLESAKDFLLHSRFEDS